MSDFAFVISFVNIEMMYRLNMKRFLLSILIGTIVFAVAVF